MRCTGCILARQQNTWQSVIVAARYRLKLAGFASNAHESLDKRRLLNQPGIPYKAHLFAVQQSNSNSLMFT